MLGFFIFVHAKNIRQRRSNARLSHQEVDSFCGQS